MTEMQVKYISLLEALFGDVPKWKLALTNGPLDDVAEAHGELIDSLMTVRNLAHDLSNLDDDRAICLMLLEEKVTQEILKLTRVTGAATAGA